jgi:hypothetical protein
MLNNKGKANTKDVLHSGTGMTSTQRKGDAQKQIIITNFFKK